MSIPPPFLPVCIPLGTRHVHRSWQLHDGRLHPLIEFPEETAELEALLSHFTLYCDVVLSHMIFPQNVEQVQMGYYVFVPECSFFEVAINRKGHRPLEMQQAALALLSLESMRFRLTQGEVMGILYVYSLAKGIRLPQSREERRVDLKEKRELLVSIAGEFWRLPYEYSWGATIEPYFRLIKKVLDLYEKWNEAFVQPMSPETKVQKKKTQKGQKGQKKSTAGMAANATANATTNATINATATDVEMS
ncbi:Protein of unknown function [Pyronema omphalodes CBS 100304]|uniref:Uncharacterized protein n=1 Tax=Pyronema omphalodes (strain CBS 100304) TaxID=1076935 RepID=U4KVY0_PYROM|nr:Protein of unknown function [Pyronema omphalodes CBS 100304]